MRSTYRKEIAKVNKSLRSEAGEEDICKPTLWYYNLLNFLNDQETPRQSQNTIDDDDISTHFEGMTQEVRISYNIFILSLT